MKKTVKTADTRDVRIRVCNRKDAADYTTYSCVEHIEEVWEIEDGHPEACYVLFMNNGETVTYDKRLWKLLKEAFVEF